MKLPFAFFILLFAAFTASQQARAADYALNFGGDNGWALHATVSVTDAAGNTFVTGHAPFDTGFNGVRYTAFGETGFFVAKIDPTGMVLWAKGFGGPVARIDANAIAVGPDGSVAVIGRYDDGALTIPLLKKLGQVDGFVMKLDADGSLLWSHPFGGANAYSNTSGVAVDGQGYVLVTGNYFNASLTDPPLPAKQAAFAIRYDKQGGTVWARTYGGGGVSFGRAAVDAGGNGYIAGSLTFGTFAGLAPYGTSDALALKIDASSGDVVWARNFGGRGGAYVSGSALALDSTGNVFLAAEMSRTSLTTPPVSLIGNQDLAALKLDPSGNLLWARNYGGPKLFAQISSVAVSGNGHLFLAGGHSLGSAGLTTPSLPRIGPRDGVLLEIDSAGSIVQADNFGGAGARAFLIGVGVDAAGNRYPIGNVSEANLTRPPLATRTRSDSIFALKMDPSGAIVRATNYVSTLGGEAGITASATDASGNLFVTGTFYVLQMNVGGIVLDRIGTTNTFVAKFDSSGIVAWAKAFGMPTTLDNVTTVASSGIALDPTGDIYVAGMSSVNSSAPSGGRQIVRNGLMMKLDANGNTIWTRDVGGSATTVVSAVASDRSGGVLVSGEFADGNLISPSITRIGDNDAFVAKLDSAGNNVWAQNFGGAGAKAHAKGLAVDTAGNAYLAGWFENASLTTPGMSRLGSRDALLVKIDPSGQTVWSRGFGGGNASTSAYANAVAVAPTGKIYLAGNFEFSDLATPPLTRVSLGSHGMLIGLDAQGAVQWAERFGAADGFPTFASAVDVDASGNVFSCVNSRSFKGIDVPGVAGAGSGSAYTFRYDASGKLLWSHATSGPSATAECTSIAADNADNVYLGGYFAFGDLASPPVARIGGRDALVVKHAAHFGIANAGLVVNASGPLHLGQKSIVFATLSGSPVPSGAVVVSADGKSCSIFLIGGVGTCQLQTSAIGIRTVTGRYTGDDQYAPQEVSVTLVVKPTLDVDGNGASDPLTDGLLILRYAFGLRGEALTKDGVGSGATRTDPAAIAGYLDQVRSTLDVDGDGSLDALTDGVITIRYLFGVRGEDLIRGTIGVRATRTTASAIEAYVESLVR